MSNNSGNQSIFSSVNVWGTGPVLSSLRITGKAIIHLLEVIGNTLFKGFVHFSNDVHFENLPTCDVYSPTYQNELATKQYVDSVATGGPIDIFNNNNIWSGTNTWENTCTFNLGQFKNFSIGEEETPVLGINTFSTELRLSANATNINGEEYVYITGSGDTIIKGGGFGVPNPEGGGLVGGTLNISSALTTLQSSTNITIEAEEITLVGVVVSTSLTEEITTEVTTERTRALGAESVLEEEIVVMQNEIDFIQAEISVGGAGIAAALQTQITSLQNSCQNTSGGGKVSTSEIHIYQTNGSGNRGTISMVERNGQTKLRMAHPVDFDNSIYIDTGGYISSHGDIDVRNTNSAVKANFIRAFYHKEHALHLGSDSDGERGEVRIDGTVNYFTRSIPRLELNNTLTSLTPTLANELTSKDYVDNSITTALTSFSAPVTLGGDQTFLGGVKTFTNLPVCTTYASTQNQFTTKGSVESILSNTLSSTLSGYASLSGIQTFLTGVKTFTDLPECSAVPSTNPQLVNKLYVDNAISSLVIGGDVTTNTEQTISGAKTFTANTTKFGEAPIYEGTAKIAILNNTLADSNVNGTINNENVYHQIQFGNRETFISQGVDNNNNTYIGQADYTSPDPNFQLTLTRGVGLKISALGTDTTTFTEALKVIGTQRVTGVATFDVLPQCSATVTLNNQLTTKSYVDSAITTGGGSFVTLNTTQDNITGGKTFKGNCAFWPVSGSTIIRGAQADIFADVTFLTGNTTTISGINCNITSTTNYIAGTTTTLDSTNLLIGLVKGASLIETFCYLRAYKVIVDSPVYSFYVNAEISNFVGAETLLQSPYTVVSALCTNFNIEADNTVIKSPYVAITNACTSLNFNATNTAFTGSVIAPTQDSTDNSQKLATTAFVNSFGNANYVTIGTTQTVSGTKTFSAKSTFSAGADIGGAGVTSNFSGTVNVPDQTVGTNTTVVANTKFVTSTLTSALTDCVTLSTNQNVSGVKTYSTKQVFNAGTACSNYDNTSMTDMTIASNSSQGILTIMNGKIKVDTFSNNFFGLFNVNNSVHVEPTVYYSQPFFSFSGIRSQNYIPMATPAGQQGPQAYCVTKINTGLLNYVAGDHFVATFTIQHNIRRYTLTNNQLASFSELEVYFYFQDANTGIVRFTTPNYASPGNHSLPYDYQMYGIIFSIFPTDMPNGAYEMYAYSRIRITDPNIPNVYCSWNDSYTSFATYNNYNTVKDTKFLSFSKSHCFRNYVAGIYLINNIASDQNIMLPVFYCIADLNNLTGQPTTTGDVPTTDNGAYSGQVGVGQYDNLRCYNKDNYWLVYPLYGLIVYDNIDYVAPITLNYRNKTNNPVVVRGTSISSASSVKVYYDNNPLLAF